MLDKRIDKIDKADIEELVTNQVREGRTLDYKQKLPTGDEDKREFLADVSAFANCQGGLLVFGMTELRDASNKNTGLPASADGIANLNLDAERLRLDSCIRDGIDPRIQGIRIEAVKGFADGEILLLKVPKSLSSPHMVTFKNYSRFFTRNTAGNSQMDVTEIRSAFLGAADLPDRIRKFRDHRISMLLNGEVPIRLEGSSRLVIHVIPMTGFSGNSSIDIQQVGEGKVRFNPIFGVGSMPRYNLDGVLYVKDSQPPLGYCQVFRNGTIEATDAYCLDSSPDIANKIMSLSIEKAILTRVKEYSESLRKLEVSGPAVIYVSLLNVRNFVMSHQFGGYLDRSPKVDRPHLILPEVLVEDVGQVLNVDKVLRPAFDTLWQGAGYSHCWNYREDGGWGHGPQ